MSDGDPQNRLTREMEHSPRAVTDAIDGAAQMWGGLWQPDDGGGVLTLPVVQGLRRGVVRGRIGIVPTATGTALSVDIETIHLRLNRSAVLILLLGAIGGMTVVLWPLSPRILQLAPVGVVLAIAAWLMVVSRLRNSGIDAFLDLVSDVAGGAEGSASG